MYRYVSLERWAALRGLRDGEALTFPRLAAASDLNVTTIRDHASRHNWAKQSFQSRKQREAWAGRGRGVAACEIMTPDLTELETLTRPEDQIAWLGDYLVRSLAKLIASRRFTAIYFWPERLCRTDRSFDRLRTGRACSRGDPSGISPARGEMPGELHLLRPARVTVPTDASGWPTGLEYREGGTRRRIGLGPSAPSTGSLSISSGGGALHLTLFHPIDDHSGFPPLEAALIALDTHNAAGRGNKALLDNSARPSGALVFAPKEGGTLSDEQFDRRKTEMEEGYSGALRAGRPLLLEGGLD